MSELLRDVDDMMRQERLMALWKAYGNYLIGAVLVLILAIGVSKAREAYLTHQAQAAMAAIQQAAATPEPAKALSAYAQGASGNAGALARMLAAGKALEAGNKDEAAALVFALQGDTSAADELRGLAALTYVRLKAADAAVKPEDLLALLTPLIADKDSPWGPQARMEAAAIQAGRLNNLPEAIKLLEPIAADPSLPFTQSERVNALLHVYQARSSEK